MELDDALALARQGDDEAFLQLWRAYQPRLVRYLQVFTSRDVEDIASETWFHVVRDLKGFRGDAQAFAGWLFSIARHRAIDASRLRNRRPVLVLDLEDEQLHRTTHVAAAEDVVLDELSTRQALALIASLPREQAEAVALSVIAGLDAPSIAKVVGASPGAVRVRIHRGLRRLELLLAPAVEGVTA